MNVIATERPRAGSRPLTLHRRQFVLGPAPLRAADDWDVVRLDDNRFFSYSAALPVVRQGSRLLAGVAVQSDPRGRDPADELATREGLDAVTRRWAGRWVLVTGSGLTLDATGTLGCYYRTIDGQLWASSSAELLRRLDPQLPPPQPPLAGVAGMDWYPPPDSGIASIARLLPSQALRSDGSVVARRLLPAVAPLAYEETIELLASRLTTVVGNVVRTFGDVWLPLTAGTDSRLLLAAACNAGVRITTFTFDLPDMSASDRELPPQLARAAGFEHHVIGEDEVDETRLALVEEHTGGQCGERSVPRAIATRQWDHVTAAVELGGGVFEAGRGYYRRGLPAAIGSTPRETADAVLAKFPKLGAAGVRAWADWLHQTQDPSVDWRDRLYIEQRAAGWLSAAAQAMDLNAADRVHVASCADYLAACLAIPDEIRSIAMHHAHLVKQMAPELMRFPVNTPPSRAARAKRRMRREIGEYRSSGSAHRYVSARLRQLRTRRAATRMA